MGWKRQCGCERSQIGSTRIQSERRGPRRAPGFVQHVIIQSGRSAKLRAGELEGQARRLREFAGETASGAQGRSEDGVECIDAAGEDDGGAMAPVACSGKARDQSVPALVAPDFADQRRRAEQADARAGAFLPRPEAQTWAAFVRTTRPWTRRSARWPPALQRGAVQAQRLDQDDAADEGFERAEKAAELGALLLVQHIERQERGAQAREGFTGVRPEAGQEFERHGRDCTAA